MITPDNVTNTAIPTQIVEWVIEFVQVKGILLKSFGQSRDAMHVHVGLALFVAAWLVWGLAGRFMPPRWRRRWWVPFAGLTAISLVAEAFDVTALMAVTAPVDPWESARDVGNTLLWPAVLSLLLRYGGKY